jgi:predicted metalloprotease with PDZ domain
MPRTLAHKALVLLALTGAFTAQAQVAALPNPAPVPAAQKTPYPGALLLQVDATDIDHKIFRVRETIPARPGPLTLLYPKWLPGTHGPYGEIGGLAGLQVRANGQPVTWTRDVVEPYAFRVEVPQGADRLELEFQFLSPTAKNGARVVMTPEMLGVQWDQVLLYPAGHEASLITLQPRLRLPAGWPWGSALRGKPGKDGWIEFEPASLETLVDSPLFAGRHFKRIELDPPGTPRPVVLNLMADAPDQMQPSDEQLKAHRQLVVQADRLFGARHFRHYDFLFALSDTFGGIGLEHHESSENGLEPQYFKDWAKGGARDRQLLPHEFTHSWNGKFRRPADLWTPDYNTQPMRNTLLWLYEGQTQYWGRVLAPRAGLLTQDQARDSLAEAAAYLEHRAGRAWRNLQDTTNEATMGERGAHKDWRSWQRGYDYYDESALIWLDADTLIREKTNGQRSLDDFARAFFGVEDGRVQPLTYTFDDIVKTLEGVMPYDWARFLRERLDGHRMPVDGLARSGWKLVYTEEPTDTFKAEAEDAKQHDFAYSIGFTVGSEDDKLRDVLWDSPAFRAGLAPGLKLVAVNGVAYKPDRLTAALKANRKGEQPIELLVRDGEQYRSVRIDYRDGPRYPRLQRIEGTPDRLTQIQSAK